MIERSQLTTLQKEVPGESFLQFFALCQLVLDVLVVGVRVADAFGAVVARYVVVVALVATCVNPHRLPHKMQRVKTTAMTAQMTRFVVLIDRISSVV